MGPVSIKELSMLAAQGVLKPTSLVWRQGLDQWIEASGISDLLTRARMSPSVVAASPIESDHQPSQSSSREPVSADSNAQAPASLPAQELKPQKWPFVLPRILLGLVLSLLLAAVSAGVLVINGKSPWLAAIVFGVVFVLSLAAGLIAYRKERYLIQDGRVICHRGGLLSDQATELEIRNITHVKLKLPWLRFKFLGVGNVIVQTAGSPRPIVLQVIPDPESVYADMRERMKSQGYDLTQRQILHEEKPAIVGIVIECIGMIFGTLVAALVVIPGFVGVLTEIKSDSATYLPLIVIGLAALSLITFAVLRFLDFRSRTYRVFNDVVVYEEGFLTREQAFIPYENIADANTRRTLLDQILGLYDVQVSCQGSSSEIKFRRLRGGVALSDAIDQLVVLARGKQKPSESTKPAGLQGGSGDRPRRMEPALIPTGHIVVGDFRMSAVRTLVPLLFLLPLFPIWIAAMIQAGVRLVSTLYSVRPGSLQHSYRFLTVHVREFAYDKITGVVIKQNLWDHLFGTMTLKFWSIGSGKPLEFAHVHGSQFDLPALMRQSGIPTPSLDPLHLEASFRLVAWLRSQLKFLPLVLLFSAGAIFAAEQVEKSLYYLLALPWVVGLVGCLYSKLFHSSQRLCLHEHHLECELGVIARSRYFVRYGNVKRTRVTRYPGGTEGRLEIFVAAEEEIGQLIQQKPQASRQQKILKHCSFAAGFIPDVRAKWLLLDDILCGRVESVPGAVAAEPFPLLLESPRGAGNAVVKLIFLSVLVVPLIVLLPITLPLTIVWAKRWRYRLESARIVAAWGVLYRSETSVLLDRVDSLQQGRGPLNKLFGNGTIRIMTAGSSKPDLTLIDASAYLALHDAIREHSK